jgi:hypothetical protein
MQPWSSLLRCKSAQGHIGTVGHGCKTTSASLQSLALLPSQTNSTVTAIHSAPFIEPFNIRVLLRVNGLNIFQPNFLFLHPCLDCRTDVLRAVVAPNHLRFASPRNALLELPNITRSEGNEKSTSMPIASRLKSSMTLNNLNVLPSSNWSCMKSIDYP